ncbi:hypothetical protein NLJ89_g6526 [Agrocybe chaxingu]|uniref:Uncharacterized protein n=1 Tax=Agrocybe chaxingu TaxID=84603 RepID=A0A9W8JY52_9AGAR|nr:hypothetical protein NLJ89_g6526 [Agrocybe chaxingu]
MSPVLPEVPPPLSFMHSPIQYGNVHGNAVISSPHGYSPPMSNGSHSLYGAVGESHGIYSSTVLPQDGPAIPSPPLTLSPTSKMAVVDTLNFELGALNSSSDQNWMAFF